MIAIKSTVFKLISQKVPLELIELGRQFENATIFEIQNVSIYKQLLLDQAVSPFVSIYIC